MVQAEQVRAGIPIIEAVSDWSRHVRQFTNRTQGHYSAVIGKFVQSLTVATIGQLRLRHYESYINSLLERGVSNRTVNANLTVLKSFSRWVLKIYGIHNYAGEIRMLREDPPKRRFLSVEQYRRILGVCSDVESDAVEFLTHTGLRASEALSLSLMDVSPDRMWIHLQMGKGRKARNVPTNATVRKILSRYNGRPESSFKFLKNSRQELFRLCRNIGKRAGVRFSPHDLRRFCACCLLQGGISLDKISSLLGHSSIRTTELYLNHQPDLSGVTDTLD